MANASNYTISVDAGHGLKPATAGKRTPAIPELGGRVVLEREFNEPTKNYLIQELKRCGFKVVDVAPELSDTPLSTRVARSDNAKANLHVSIHYNALNSVWGTHGGIEVLAGSSASSKNVAKLMVDALVKETGFRNRGVKDGSWLYLNKVKCPLALAECGFMDNKQEALKMVDSAHQQACARAIAKAVCSYFGVKYVSSNTTSTPSKPADSANHTSGHIGVATVKVDALNLRSEPSVNGKLIRTLKKGEAYKVYAIKDGWYNLGVNQWASNVGNKYMTYKAVEPTTHTVTKGDTLWGISQKYKTTVAKLKELNGLKSDVIQIGQKLRVK